MPIILHVTHQKSPNGPVCQFTLTTDLTKVTGKYRALTVSFLDLMISSTLRDNYLDTFMNISMHIGIYVFIHLVYIVSLTACNSPGTLVIQSTRH